MKNALIFYKIKPCEVTDENISEVLHICSLQNPPINSFYNIMQKVYAPTLFQV